MEFTHNLFAHYEFEIKNEIFKSFGYLYLFHVLYENTFKLISIESICFFNELYDIAIHILIDQFDYYSRNLYLFVQMST